MFYRYDPTKKTEWIAPELDPEAARCAVRESFRFHVWGYNFERWANGKARPEQIHPKFRQHHKRFNGWYPEVDLVMHSGSSTTVWSSTHATFAAELRWCSFPSENTHDGIAITAYGFDGMAAWAKSQSARYDSRVAKILLPGEPLPNDCETVRIRRKLVEAVFVVDLTGNYYLRMPVMGKPDIYIAKDFDVCFEDPRDAVMFRMDPGKFLLPVTNDAMGRSVIHERA